MSRYQPYELTSDDIATMRQEYENLPRADHAEAQVQEQIANSNGRITSIFHFCKWFDDTTIVMFETFVNHSIELYRFGKTV